MKIDRLGSGPAQPLVPPLLIWCTTAARDPRFCATGCAARARLRRTDTCTGRSTGTSTTGEQVHRFLESFTGRVRIPVSLGYSPRLQLGVTEALPDGQSSRAGPVGRRARSDALDRPHPGCPHSTARAVVPVRTVRHLYRELDQQLNVVQRYGPKSLTRFAPGCRPRTEPAGRRRGLVSRRFTPAQVLLADNTVCGLVDFDTVCGASRHGPRPIPRSPGSARRQGVRPGRCPHGRAAGRGLPERLQRCAGPQRVEEPFWSRVSLFRVLSLASTALCTLPSAKQRRADLALALLSAADHTTDHLTGRPPLMNTCLTPKR